MVFILPGPHRLLERRFLPGEQEFFPNRFGDKSAPLALLDEAVQVGENFFREGDVCARRAHEEKWGNFTHLQCSGDRPIGQGHLYVPRPRLERPSIVCVGVMFSHQNQLGRHPSVGSNVYFAQNGLRR